MIKREHVRDDMMFINFAKSLRDVEISALAEMEGELPKKLNRVLLDFRFELRSKDSSWKYLKQAIQDIRNFDLAMGYIYFVEQVHILRDVVTEKDMQGLDLVIGYTLLANACLLLLNFREKLTLGDLIECKVNSRTKDIEFDYFTDNVERAVLQDPYEIYYIDEKDSRGTTLIDSLMFKDKLFNLVAFGKPPVYKENTPLELRRVKTYEDGLGVFDSPMVVALDSKAWEELLPGVVYFKIQNVKLYGMRHLALEVTDYKMNKWNINIPQYGDTGYAIGIKIPAFMSIVRKILSRDLDGLNIM